MSESSGAASTSETTFLRRILKWAGGLLGGLAVLVLVAALVLPRLFTSEQLKGYVIPPLEEATGRQVAINAIGLRVLPAPAIRVSGFRLANAEGYGPAPAVQAQALNVNVALWPLFLANIRPTAVSLERPVVRYVVAEDGATNFDDLGGEADTTAEEGPLLGGIPLSNVQVTEGQLHYTDRSTDQALRLDLGAQLGIVPDGSVLTSSGTIELGSVRAVLPSVGPDTLAVQDARATYDVQVTPSAGQVDLRTLRLETAPLSLSATGTLSGLNEEPAVDLTFETGATDLAEITSFVPAAAVEGVNPQGTLDLTGTVSGVLSAETDTKNALAVSATGQLAGGGLDYEDSALLRDLSGDLALSLDDVVLRSVDGQLLGTSLKGSAALQQLRGNPQMNLDLETGPMDLSALVAFAPPEQVNAYSPQGTLRLDATANGPMPTDAASLQKVTVNGTGQLAEFGVDYEGQSLLRSLNTTLQFSGTTVSAREMDGQLLGKPVSGEVTVQDPWGTPQVKGQLAGTAELTSLMALAGDESQPGSISGTADYDVRFAGPLDTPEAIQPNGLVQLTDVQVPYESFRQPIEISGATVQLTGTGVSMDRFTVRSGKQTAAVQTTVKNLFPVSKGLAESDPALSASFTLTSDRLDLAELYPEAQTSDVSYSQLFAAQLSESKVKGQSPEALAKEVYGDTELPANAVDGRVEIGTLLNDPQRFDDLSFDVRMEDRRLAVRNLTATTYGGTLAGTLTLDQSGSATSASAPRDGSVWLAASGSGRAPADVYRADSRSTLTYDFELQDAEAGDFLDDWTSLGRLVTGTLTFDVDGDTPLTEGLLPEVTTFTAIGQSIVADGGLSIDSGPASALVNSLNLPVPSLKNFKRLGGDFTIKDGRLQVKSWAFAGDQFDGTMQGALGLGGSLDLEMTLDLPLEMIQGSGIGSRLGGGDGQTSKVLEKLLGRPVDNETIPVTLRFGGTMGNPTVQMLNQDAIQSRIESLAKERGLNLLRDFFGGGGNGNR